MTGNYFKQKSLLTLVFLCALSIARSEVVPYTPAEIEQSRDYKVWVNNQEVFVGLAGNDHHGFYSFTTFDFTGSINIRVKVTKAVKWLDILPSGLHIPYKVIDDFTFEFHLDEPKKLTLFLNNERKDALHILTSRPESSKPDPNDKNVLYYQAGKVYNIGVLDLKDNQTLYIEGGARLKGMVRARNAKNIKILGRGMIDGSDNVSSGNAPETDQPWRLIYMEHSNNIEIEGITLFNSLRWTIHPYDCQVLEIHNIRVLNWNYGSDGTDLSSCQHVRITDSFYRTNDDCIVLKAIGFSDHMHYPNPRPINPDVRDITVENCVFWNMAYGNVIDIGFELRSNKIEDVVFRNCDVIMSEDRGAVFSIHNSDYATIENVLYENIRIENADMIHGHKLFDLAIVFSIWGYDKFEDPEMNSKYCYSDAWDNLLPVLPGTEAFHAQYRGHIRNIHFKNIQVLDGKFPYSIIQGFDENHLVDGVTFENITVKGTKIKNEKKLKLYKRFANSVVIK